MIVYFKHHEIDKKKWNACIAASHNAKVYALAEYLDIVAPGWQALVENDYEAVFPVARKTKLMIRYFYQPTFTKYFDVYGANNNLQSSHWTKALHNLFKHAHLASVNLKYLLPFPEFHTTGQIMQQLNLESTYPEIAENYTRNIRKNLKKASKHEFRIDEGVDLKEFIKLKSLNYRFAVSDNNLKMLGKILENNSRKWKTNIVGIKNAEGKYILISTSVVFQNTVYFLSSAASEEARQKKVKFILYDFLIKKYAGKNYRLDFMGSNISNVAYFNHGFGATDKRYYHYDRKGWLPQLLKMAGK